MPEPICACELCGNDHPFELPEGLLHDIMSGKVAIFAGAGISTEASTVLSWSLYDDVAAYLKVEKEGLDFPVVMQKFCEQRDGRLKLVNKIRERFSYIDSFSELRRNAVRFHRELATFFPIDTIITTNWDAYFEEECSATPFITDEDVALWEVAERKVLKIHGSINNLGSIVATSKDYEVSKHALHNNLIGARLKTILSDRTVIYIGYSYRDYDFKFINDFVSEKLGEFGKQSFIITLDDSPEAMSRYLGARLSPIFTDGAFFIKTLKEHAAGSYCLLKDDIYPEALSLLSDVGFEHEWMHGYKKAKKRPETIYSAFYQDGLVHALERAVSMRKTGEYSDRHRLLAKIRTYDEMSKKKLKEKKYDDVAYIEGYLSGLLYILTVGTEDELYPPLYFGFGVGDIWDRSDFKTKLPEMSTAHKAASRLADKRSKELKALGGDLEWHHRPQLL